MADDDYGVPIDWYGEEADLFDDLINGDPVLGEDHKLQMLFDLALFDSDIRPEERDAIHAYMLEYLWDEYGIDFDDEFDWEGYREWYGEYVS